MIQHPFSSRGRAALSTTASSSGMALKSRIVIHHPFLDYSALVVEVWHKHRQTTYSLPMPACDPQPIFQATNFSEAKSCMRKLLYDHRLLTIKWKVAPLMIHSCTQHRSIPVSNWIISLIGEELLQKRRVFFFGISCFGWESKAILAMPK